MPRRSTSRPASFLTEARQQRDGPPAHPLTQKQAPTQGELCVCNLQLWRAFVKGSRGDACPAGPPSPSTCMLSFHFLLSSRPAAFSNWLHVMMHPPCTSGATPCRRQRGKAQTHGVHRRWR
jgi:hypothetical protein